MLAAPAASAAPAATDEYRLDLQGRVATPSPPPIRAASPISPSPYPAGSGRRGLSAAEPAERRRRSGIRRADRASRRARRSDPAGACGPAALSAGSLTRCIALLALILALVAALSGCGGGSDDEAPASAQDPFFGIAPVEVPTSADFTRMAAGGIGSYRVVVGWRSRAPTTGRASTSSSASWPETASSPSLPRLGRRRSTRRSSGSTRTSSDEALDAWSEVPRGGGRALRARRGLLGGARAIRSRRRPSADAALGRSGTSRTARLLESTAPARRSTRAATMPRST